MADPTGTLVDSNVLLDVMTRDSVWENWSARALADAADRGPLVINPLIYAEVSVRYSRVEQLDEVLDPRDFRRDPLPWSAAFLAGKAHQSNRRRGGTAGSTLPDFFIGAHAAVSRLALLTRDVARYRTYFPSVPLHAPDRGPVG